jgi:hypothetical protein
MTKKLGIAAVLAAGLAIGSLAGVHAKLPAPPPMTDAEKAAKAEKDAAAKAKDAEMLGKAQDRAVANYKKGKGISMDGKAAPQKTSAKK